MTKKTHANSGRRMFKRSQLRDITLRKQAEEALQKAKEKYHNIFENAVEGIFQTTPDGRYLSANPALARMFGYESPEDLVTSITDIGQQQYLELARRVEFKRLMEAHGIVEGFECQMYRRDGGTVWVSEHARAVRRDDGTMLYYEGTVQDITDRKRAEEALRESQERFRSAFGSAAIGMALVAPNGHWLQVNPALCEIVGYSEQELLATTFQAITHPDDLEADLECVRQMLAGEIQTYQMEKRYFHKLGRIVWILLSVSLVRDVQGKPLYFISQIQDITDRKKAEVELQNSLKLSRALSRRLESVREEERTRIARDLHDEIGQALTALKLNLQVAQPEGPNELRSPPYNSISIIDRLLERVRAISLDLRPSLLDDLGLIATLKWWTAHQTPQTAARLELIADPISPRLPLDMETACFRIVEEAVNNATKYAQAEHISVILRKQGRKLDLLVRDDGAGFDVSAAFARSARGESIGLLGMEERVMQFGGLFTITSRPGGGTEIRATFPLDKWARTHKKTETSTSR